MRSELRFVLAQREPGSLSAMRAMSLQRCTCLAFSMGSKDFLWVVALIPRVETVF